MILVLAGCSNTADIAKQETVEAAESVYTSAVASELTQTQATVMEPEPEPEPQLFCDFEAERVTDSDYDEFIDAAEEYMVENEYQGAVLLAYNGEIILASGYGYADEMTGRKCKAYDTFEIGSISKQMTAAAVLQLAEQGKLGLDDTIDEYFPDYKYGSMTTIRHLLQMRSGMVDFINNPALYFPEDYLEQYIAAADTGDDSEEILEREFLLKYLNYPSLHNVPGDGFNYSNTNYYLLGLIMEQVTGESFQEYMLREIFERCDMLTANNDFRNTTARGYYEDGTSLSMSLSTSLGCGSVNASVYDLYQWGTHLFAGDVMSKRSLREMLSAIDNYGLGMRTDGDVYFHRGNTDVFNGFIAFYPDGFVTIALTNCPMREVNAGNIASELHVFFEDICKQP